MARRWVAWYGVEAMVRLEERMDQLGGQTPALELVQRRPGSYATRAHAVVEGVGLDGGQAGAARCGVQVPADRPEHGDPALWWSSADPEGRGLEGVQLCRRCLRMGGLG